ncbi:MAG: hypothetical protein COV52_00335 [Gammaproteobacteria bacterium CG11_big_fil_rev_8_21_14_0_20_46_22]|nr:MAG: hypothetical protein COW05_09170 [Gammaproteobacteria bacterium CG12_big_fil_rev_8_21_14_0_65_46_12]PIR12106.1 MAG: hypothetical protein COV52_00335 [Gammaproteobacteria bacterium CG11_big_fil_rev_8_21_14_0_20_46_22]
MGKLKYTLALLSCSLLAACSVVPGTYFSYNSLNDTYVANGKTHHVYIVPVTANSIAKHYSAPRDYRVGPYDILNIIVWDHPELTTPTNQEANPEQTGILVSQEGDIFFPFAGSVKVSGLTLNQIRVLLESRIRAYIRDPQISVRVAVFRSKEVQVMGEVGKAGVQPITDRPLSIMDAINNAGGANTVTANTSQIYVLRYTKGNIYAFWVNAQMPDQVVAAEHFYLRNNDVVYVPPAGVSAWNRVITQILPTLSGASSTKSVTGV